MNRNKNWNCSGERCVTPNGEVRVYPLGGGANLILCRACWTHENLYRHSRGVTSKRPQDWPQQNWQAAEVYRV